MMDEDQRRLLGSFVRARRESIAPNAPTRRRRTLGLRREELAARAGIGVTWVAWIEQGREVRASAETLARLADGLNLTRAERAYLFTLAARHDPADPFSQRPTEAPPAINALVQGLDWPAYGLDAAWNTLWDLARSQFPSCVLRSRRSVASLDRDQGRRSSRFVTTNKLS